MDLISIVFGMVVGGIISFIAAKVIYSKTNLVPQDLLIKSQNEISVLNKEIELLRINVEANVKQLESERDSKLILSSDFSRVNTENKNLELRLTEQKEQLELQILQLICF